MGKQESGQVGTHAPGDFPTYPLSRLPTFEPRARGTEERFLKASNNLGLAGRIARTFIDSKLTPLVILASVLLGGFAVIMLPREEEPQIKVPMVDVLVVMPGFSAKEVEERATRRRGSSRRRSAGP